LELELKKEEKDTNIKIYNDLILIQVQKLSINNMLL